MGKELGDSEQSHASLFTAAATRFSRLGSKRSVSPPASKYRLTSVSSLSEVPVSTSSRSVFPSVAPTSPVAKKLQDLVRQVSSKSNKAFDFSDVAVTNIDRSLASPQHAKLPQKIRSSVTRMRSQLALVNNNNNEVVSSARQRRSIVLAQTQVSPTLSGGASPKRYSRRSKEMTDFQASRVKDRFSPNPISQTSTPSLVQKSAVTESGHSVIHRFMELLRPLQSSMTSLREAGSASGDDEDEEEADALFRQHERDSSRILRICCSLDNLLLAVVDTVRENKLDLMAIVCGPARELVQLTLSGVRQIAAAMVTTLPNGENVELGAFPSLTAKEERHLREFLVEIADRWSELDELLRTVYASALQAVQAELAELKAEFSSLQMEKQTLELEVIDMREFASSQNAANIAVSSNFMRLADQEESTKRPETEEGDLRQDTDNLQGYNLEQRLEEGGERRTDADEINMLKKQCDEYGRLLEMAKQEIRLSHQERQSQHARLIELSQSLLRDQEVSQLRCELQSEKKRVKLLEIESLRLRQTEIDLNSKIQSLLLNQPPGATPKSGVRGNEPLTQHSRASSLVLRPEEVANILDGGAQGSAGQEGVEYQAALPSVSLQAFATNPVASQSRVSWLIRVVSTCEKRVGVEEDDGLTRKFLADLMISGRELEAVKAQAKLRKRASVPTIGKPPSVPRLSQRNPTKKKRINQGTPSDLYSVAISAQEWVQDLCVVTSVRQLVWVFYEQYLMAEEARRIDPQLCRFKWHRETTAPLSAFVLHYFLERHATESDALLNLRRFVGVLTKLRGEYGDIQLFCELLEGQRGQEELHFLLWILQAVSSVELGIDYDVDSEFAAKSDRITSHICTLKAMYLTRMIYQLLLVKSLKRPSPKTVLSTKQAKASQDSSADQTSSLPLSPSKRRRKSRPISANVTQSMPTIVEPAAEQTANQSILVRARLQYAEAITANSGFPLTLETFNNLLLSYSTSPSDEELLDRLGPYYQITGDERKVAVDVFLVLLMEMFSTQLEWRKAQLKALFVRLAKEEEIAILVAAKKRQEEEAAAGDTAFKGRQKNKTLMGRKKVKKASPTSPKKRSRRAGLDGSADRYLRGLNRDRLQKFLRQGGLVSSQDHDVDALYVTLLDISNATPSDIHFDQIYECFLELNFFGNASFAVDFSTWESNKEPQKRESHLNQRKKILDVWQRMSSLTLALTENDPNVYTRNAGRRLYDRVVNTVCKTPTSSLRTCDGDIDTVGAVREFLGFAWRVACRRAGASASSSSQFDWCLTEFYHLNQAVKVIISCDDHYASNFEMANTSPDGERLKASVEEGIICELLVKLARSLEPENMVPCWRTTELIQVQGVLLRFSLCIAQLFGYYSSSQLVTGIRVLEKDRWMAMVQDLCVLDEQVIPVSICEKLFIAAAALQLSESTNENQNQTTEQDEKTEVSSRTDNVNRECVIDKYRFIVLLVHTALQRHYATERKRSGPDGSKKSKQPMTWTTPRIVERFCRDVIAQNAFSIPKKFLKLDFTRKLETPLIAKALLEMRPFLRHLFFKYVKIANSGHVDGDEPTAPDANGALRLLKNKHNSLTFTQFSNFLHDFNLLEPAVTLRLKTTMAADLGGIEPKLDAYLFRAVMSVDSEDDDRMEFDEFVVALAALAVMKNPNPFVQLHTKIGIFLSELRAHARHEVVTS